MKNPIILLLIGVIAALAIWFAARWYEQKSVLTNFEKCMQECEKLPNSEAIEQEYNSCVSAAKAGFFQARTACAPLSGFDKDQCFDAAIQDYSEALSACMNKKSAALKSLMQCVKGCAHHDYNSTLEE